MQKKTYSGAMSADPRETLQPLSPTYQRAIDVTIGLIAENGVKGTSLRDIGAAAQVNFGNLASHFGGKDGVMAECFRQVARSSLERERAFFYEACSLGLRPDHGAAVLWDLCQAAGTRYRVQTLVLMELLLSAQGHPLFEEIMAGWFAERCELIRDWGGAAGLPAVACDVLHLHTLAESCFYLSCGQSLLYRLTAMASLAEAYEASSGIPAVGLAPGLPGLAAAFYADGRPPASDPGKDSAGATTRAQIIEAAADIVAGHGLDGVTTRLVAQKAGISLGLITYHFPSVAKLGLAGLNRLLERVIEELEDPETRNPVLDRLLGEERRPLTIPRASLLAYRSMLQLALTAGRMPSQAVVGQMLRSKMGQVVMRAMAVSQSRQESRTLAGSFALVTSALFTIAPAMQSRELPLDLAELLHCLTYRMLGFEQAPEA